MEDINSLSKIDLLMQASEMNPYEKISKLDGFLKKLPDFTTHDEKYELGLGCRYEHSFTKGLYIRKMFVPKGLVFITAIHKTQHPLFITHGDVTIYSDGEVKRVQAPYFHITEEGVQRALITHEDTVGVTCHVTDKTNVEDICKDLFVDTYQEFLQIDRDDYESIVSRSNLSEDLIQRMMKVLDNIEFDDEYSHLVKFQSNVHGIGLKTTKKIESGKFVCPVNINGVRTPAARYINHSKFNNCQMVHDGDSMNLCSVKDIWAGQELTINYSERFRDLNIFKIKES